MRKMNPARSLGPAIAGDVWVGHWIYWTAPLLGTIAAARVYEMVRSGEAPRVGTATGVEGEIA